jgi:hypothetical protein
MNYQKGDFFLDKNTHKLYIFDGKEWWRIVLDLNLKKLDWIT